ncbi:hypothetical protein [Parendozoicomonas sp. Alg238-R29]|uniref:hypothetical protein n=1 Tax=Parendozoicomonas sp. Alg238-R29 TaxID=2993446 RepID=UPI00248F0CC2|nr:hypothetical protein [Parendozoicomonas sp. Alg238-R29]
MPKLVETLVQTFASEPLFRWMYPDDSDYFRIVPGLFRATVKPALGQGTVYVSAGCRVVSVWVPDFDPSVEVGLMSDEKLQWHREYIPSVMLREPDCRAGLSG